MADMLGLIGVTSASSLGSLFPVFKVVEKMADTYEHVRFGQKRCRLVIRGSALIIKEVHHNLQSDPSSMLHISKLREKFEEIESILQKLAGMSLFKALLHFDDVNKEIERANACLDSCLQLFPINLSSHVQARNKAAISDWDALRALLKAIAGNYEEIRRRFGIHSDEQEDQAMAVMERELRNAKVTSEEDTPVEVQIMQKSLECIKSTTGRSAPEQRKWMITEYDLDYCGTIGGGGFSTVRKALFRGTMVSVKILKDHGNVKEALEREIEIWSKLRHDHIVPFYGASILTSPPYIVSRYMQNGNLVQYLVAKPGADRTKLIFEVSLGMYYLHEELIVHGDLKGVNVLVDDSGKACITDFGLSKVCASGTPGTKTGVIAGTLRFLAPEALGGEPLSFETDVYAFGMLIYEVFTGEVPFIREPDHLVKEGHVELDRPTSSKVYDRGFNDAFWQLLSECISRDPSTRPRFRSIQARLYSLKKAERPASSVQSDSTPEDRRRSLTDWMLDTEPTTYASPSMVNGVAPLLKNNRSASAEQSDISSGKSMTLKMKTYSSVLPMSIEVTHRYFSAKFGVSAREPGAYLEETDTFHWQPIRAKKGSFLSEEGNGFSYSSTIGRAKNSWELNGTDVTLRTSVNTGVCRFKNAQIAQRWYRLQLNYARNGSVGDLGTAMGSWVYTERSWRRLAYGKFEKADVVGGDPDTLPTDNAWSDVDLPKRRFIDNYACTENCTVCITNPGKRPGRFCCRREGRQIVFDTYRQQGDKEPIVTREETYPSEEYASTTFDVLRAALEKTEEKHNRTFLFSF